MCSPHTKQHTHNTRTTQQTTTKKTQGIITVKLQKTYNATKVTIKEIDEEQTGMQIDSTTVRCGQEYRSREKEC